MGNGGATQPVIVYVIGTSIGPPEADTQAGAEGADPFWTCCFCNTPIIIL